MTFSIEKQHDKIDIARLMADERVVTAINEALIELARAERLHPVWSEDVLEMVCRVLERAKKAHGEAICIEYDKKRANYPELRRRLVQTIAMSLRTLINLEDGKND